MKLLGVDVDINDFLPPKMSKKERAEADARLALHDAERAADDQFVADIPANLESFVKAMDEVWSGWRTDEERTRAHFLKNKIWVRARAWCLKQEPDVAVQLAEQLASDNPHATHRPMLCNCQHALLVDCRSHACSAAQMDGAKLVAEALVKLTRKP